ncbi:VanZ family protein [Tomitella biformata]|uniref:VanZ family protein n=1 Tax=Tomitella biformata TaxID=630403 RepID=UPI000688BEAE|nr:VanZ family protein [Tomitella biformata]
MGRLSEAVRWSVFPLSAVFALSLVILFSPGSTVPSGPPNSDKVVHALLFAALAAASRLAGVGWRVTIAWVLAYAALSEVLQATLPIHRSGSWWDLAADAFGMALGLVVCAVITRSRRL